MRAPVMAIVAVGLMMSGCAIKNPLKHPLFSRKAETTQTGPSCPAMKNEAWQPVVDEAIHKMFDRDLQKRFGDTATHVRIGWSKTDKGDTVVTAHRIGPAAFAMPEPGKGGQVEVVFQACTGKFLKAHKRANLERKPKPLAN